MTHPDDTAPAARRPTIDLDAEAFREIGHALIERVAGFLESIRERPVTPGEPPSVVRSVLGAKPLPENGMPAKALLEETATLMFEHSLLNGHPRFFGYITSSAAPLGALGDLLAAAVNANVGLWDLAPLATEIERQTIRWIAELTGYPSDCGGLMVSGGNMANLVAFFAARRAAAPWDVRAAGLQSAPAPLTLYCSDQTHTWIEKAADLGGLGTETIRWIGTDRSQRLDVQALERRIADDLAAGCKPIMVIGTAGTVGTGAIDPLPEIADVCERHGVWFHVDGAYGAPAAALPDAPAELGALARADSLALDPHKWLFAPLEAGCILVRSPSRLTEAFSFHPAYYRLDQSDEDPKLNYYEQGMQNSRGFRALKVWLTLRHLGKAGHVELIRRNVALARRLFEQVAAHPSLEAVTHNLSIATFRFVPPDLAGRTDAEAYLNRLNSALLARLQAGGEVFVSNALIEDRFVLRACIVNFRTTPADVDRLVATVAEAGAALDRTLRSEKASSR